MDRGRRTGVGRGPRGRALTRIGAVDPLRPLRYRCAWAVVHRLILRSAHSHGAIKQGEGATRPRAVVAFRSASQVGDAEPDVETAMTKGKKFKKQVHARAERNGTSYSNAHGVLDGRSGAAMAAVVETGSATEPQLIESLRASESEIMRLIRADAVPVSKELLERLGTLGQQLHEVLEARGLTPRHRKHLVQNRRAPEGSADFYTHVHAAQSLLRFVADPHANDDPEDQTIDHEFTLRVYVRRWSNTEMIKVRRTRTGWSFAYVSAPISADKDGRVGGAARSGLFELLDHEMMNYPAGLPGYLEYLWERAAEDGLDHAAVQAELDKLGAWISTCERSSPGGLFKHYS